MMGELAHEYSKRFNEARAETAFNAEVERLERLANPAPAPGQRTTAELLERRELRDDLERGWSRSPDGILDGYKAAVRIGDTMAAELFEQHAAEYIRD